MLSLSKIVNSSLAAGSAPSSEGDESEPSDSSGSSGSSSRGPGPDGRSPPLPPGAICPLLARTHLEVCADRAIQLSHSLIGPLHANAVNDVRAVGKNPMEHAAEYIWQLGLEHPESGLVPGSDYDQIATLQFVNVWIMHVLPALVCSSPMSPSADLARLNKWIVSRRHALGRRGPFWNGRSLCIAEVIVAPFSDAMLHGSNFIPDSQEFSAVSSWLAAIRCALY
ncbi:hypothetical protein IW140_005346 [Coemansia sp. RSA 1813]|nr:hypothetical protein EV178_005279 [Coemansia sp. RSA 1646]KAJ2086987.1 hypothetical protein IW138_005267 [Coemansia sp. RSA 986]KAJ2215594.1 hypothetical protein EV179_002004 [Coemansia sp. RSA 487]KAJ2565449.1 hypothetical protein IW140_005346 [Coemansia sp. RSA 1813]